ncbi:hypothetical protein DLAC_10654 [Tieghemostelium lacteum]|uniref:Uncharacterized protein n=1 Tax=Tieghemostelium lacteum TaxID=361077 RepID=A0A151Z4I2_TIELA|nr:hypothetical protein DLAC_10654 [Tieghemostelium lacteum]|eukprot:KYQ88851.1 hypothetical protein DLAC_10654 [Tieghemostelium lacteum]
MSTLAKNYFFNSPKNQESLIHVQPATIVKLKNLLNFESNMKSLFVEPMISLYSSMSDKELVALGIDNLIAIFQLAMPLDIPLSKEMIVGHGVNLLFSRLLPIAHQLGTCESTLKAVYNSCWMFLSVLVNICRFNTFMYKHLVSGILKLLEYYPSEIVGANLVLLFNKYSGDTTIPLLLPLLRGRQDLAEFVLVKNGVLKIIQKLVISSQIDTNWEYSLPINLHFIEFCLPLILKEDSNPPMEILNHIFRRFTNGKLYQLLWQVYPSALDLHPNIFQLVKTTTVMVPKSIGIFLNVITFKSLEIETEYLQYLQSQFQKLDLHNSMEMDKLHILIECDKKFTNAIHKRILTEMMEYLLANIDKFKTYNHIDEYAMVVIQGLFKLYNKYGVRYEKLCNLGLNLLVGCVSRGSANVISSALEFYQNVIVKDYDKELFHYLTYVHILHTPNVVSYRHVFQFYRITINYLSGKKYLNLIDFSALFTLSQQILSIQLNSDIIEIIKFLLYLCDIQPLQQQHVQNNQSIYNKFAKTINQIAFDKTDISSNSKEFRHEIHTLIQNLLFNCVENNFDVQSPPPINDILSLLYSYNLEHYFSFAQLVLMLLKTDNPHLMKSHLQYLIQLDQHQPKISSQSLEVIINQHFNTIQWYQSSISLYNSFITQKSITANDSNYNVKLPHYIWKLILYRLYKIEFRLELTLICKDVFKVSKDLVYNTRIRCLENRYRMSQMYTKDQDNASEFKLVMNRVLDYRQLVNSVNPLQIQSHVVSLNWVGASNTLIFVPVQKLVSLKTLIVSDINSASSCKWYRFLAKTGNLNTLKWVVRQSTQLDTQLNILNFFEKLIQNNESTLRTVKIKFLEFVPPLSQLEDIIDHITILSTKRSGTKLVPLNVKVISKLVKGKQINPWAINYHHLSILLSNFGIPHNLLSTQHNNLTRLEIIENHLHHQVEKELVKSLILNSPNLQRFTYTILESKVLIVDQVLSYILPADNNIQHITVKKKITNSGLPDEINVVLVNNIFSVIHKKALSCHTLSLYQETVHTNSSSSENRIVSFLNHSLYKKVNLLDMEPSQHQDPYNLTLFHRKDKY